MMYEEAARILQKIQTMTDGDTALADLERDVVSRCVRYARLRTEWQLADLTKRREMDASRTAAHNALIDACNILSRALSVRGKETSWRTELGQNRQEIGDFACYVHCLLGLSAR